MKNLKIITLFLIMVMMLTISAVSAADIGNSTDLSIFQDESDLLEDYIDINPVIIPDGDNFTSIQDMGGLDIDENYAGVSHIEIKNDFTVNGQDICDVNNSGRINVGNDKTSALNGITLKNANGGPIYDDVLTCSCDDNVLASAVSTVNTSIDTYFEVDSKFTRVANDYYAGERGAMFYAILKDCDGNILANKTVQIAVNGPIYNVTTDEQGKAGLMVNLMIANVYTYALFFSGDDMYNSAPTASTKLTIIKKNITIKATGKSFKASAKTKTLSVTLKTSKNPYDGQYYLKAGKKVTLKIKNKTFSGKINGRGVAEIIIKWSKKGKYTGKITFKGDKTYSKAKKSIKLTFK